MVISVGFRLIMYLIIYLLNMQIATKYLSVWVLFYSRQEEVDALEK